MTTQDELRSFAGLFTRAASEMDALEQNLATTQAALDQALADVVDLHTRLTGALDTVAQRDAEIQAKNLVIEGLNAEVSRLQAELEACGGTPPPPPPPTGHVLLGVADSFYEDFSNKVVRHPCVRMYAADQSIGSGRWAKIRSIAMAGNKVFVSVKRFDEAHLAAIHDEVAAYPVRPTLDAFHEFEDNIENGEFDVAEYVAAARVFYEELNDVADIGWCTMAWSWTSGAPDSREALVRAAYPGDDVVDVIAADGYIRENTTQAFPNVFGPWVAANRDRGKPLAILEWGVNENANGMTQAIRAAKTNEFFDYVKSVPEIETACLWENLTTKNGQLNDYQIRDDAEPRDAYKAKAADPYFQRTV